LIVWFPRGIASCDVDILKNVLTNPVEQGVMEMDSFLFTRAIEDAMMPRRSSRNQTLCDPFTVSHVMFQRNVLRQSTGPAKTMTQSV
jgi:hypothetical protein